MDLTAREGPSGQRKRERKREREGGVKGKGEKLRGGKGEEGEREGGKDGEGEKLRRGKGEGEEEGERVSFFHVLM